MCTEGAVCFSTGAEEQKFANLRANPHVVLTTGCNRWDRGLDVVVEGRAVRVTGEDALKRLAAAFTARWDGGGSPRCATAASHHPGGGAALVFSVTPVRVFAHTKGDPFGATMHKF